MRGRRTAEQIVANRFALMAETAADKLEELRAIRGGEVGCFGISSTTAESTFGGGRNAPPEL